MKKIIAILLVAFCATAIFSACDTQEKCAAYGHYSYNEVPSTPAEPIAQVD